MHFGGDFIQLNLPISLDTSLLTTKGRDETQAAVRRIVCSVKFELRDEGDAFRLLGPDMSYHQVDPHLVKCLRDFREDMTAADILSYRTSTRSFDLCFEDSWTGYFIARRMQARSRQEDLVLIHLDDHTDMMSTLLCRSREGLIDPTSGVTFDPSACWDWEAAIHSGATSIGNFVTPLYYSDRTVHVRHITNATDCDELCYVSRERRCYELIPGREFAAVRKSSISLPETVGTYMAGTSAERVLEGLPRAWTLVHIDLDYFINDFNGASRGNGYVPDPALRVESQKKMDRFFESLAKVDPVVDRWMIATSPGFCSAFHWKWLLSEIETRIQIFEGRRVDSN